MNRSFKRTAFFYIIYCNNINVFTLTFDQFNGSLQNKSNYYRLNFLTIVHFSQLYYFEYILAIF